MAKQRQMTPRGSRPELTEADIQVGKFYRGKNPAKAGFSQKLNDREVVWISKDRKRLQYDSSAVANGRTYPMVSMEAFLKWASHQVH